MTFEDMYLLGFAFGLGFSFSKFFYGLFSDWVDSLWKDWKKPSYILEGILIFLFLAYLGVSLASRQLF